jgi:pimeloyl-ACP methyl ester carboxylesterase
VVPTLLLDGEHETSVGSRHVPTLVAGIPDSTVVVPDAGHASPWDDPECFADAIREFLADRVSSTSE